MKLVLPPPANLNDSDSDRLKADPYLDPLRDRHDFRELLAELGAPP